MRFSVLIPTHTHASTLQLAVESVRAQTLSAHEILIVGDGPDDETDAVARRLGNGDGVRYLPFPKGRRLGEDHRHEVLTNEATGDAVAYLADDDLMMPDHLARLEGALDDNDVAHTAALFVGPDRVWVRAGDLSLPVWRREIRRGQNFLPLGPLAHTAAFYRRLPAGWRPGPTELPSDLHMWRQLMTTASWARMVFVPAVTVIHFPSPLRPSADAGQRRGEVERWWSRVEDGSIHAIVEEALLVRLTEAEGRSLRLARRLREVDGPGSDSMGS